MLSLGLLIGRGPASGQPASCEAGRGSTERSAHPDEHRSLLGALIPEQAIICDESVSTGRAFFSQTHGAPPHDRLQLTGGSIGLGIPVAVGAAITCPDRKVIALQADGSGLYTVQGL